MTLRLWVCAFSLALALHGNTAQVKAEPNLERRSELALSHADAELAAARKAYEAGELDNFRKLIEEVAELADLSIESLDSTGKRARRAPKYFKRAEQRLLVLIRKVDSFEKDVAAEDRPTVAAVRKRLSDVHDRVLNDIMTKK